MATVEFLFDYASPFAFLANESLGAIIPNVEISYRPVYLRGFESFASGMPFTAPKLAYLMLDLRRCASDLGIALRIPSTLPDQRPLRTAWCDRRATRGAFRRVPPRDLRSGLAIRAGHLAQGRRQRDRDRARELRANTKAAVKRGVFGLPTFFVGPEMFWGHDRMHQVAAAAITAPR